MSESSTTTDQAPGLRPDSLHLTQRSHYGCSIWDLCGVPLGMDHPPPGVHKFKLFLDRVIGVGLLLDGCPREKGTLGTHHMPELPWERSAELQL